MMKAQTNIFSIETRIVSNVFWDFISPMVVHLLYPSLWIWRFSLRRVFEFDPFEVESLRKNDLGVKLKPKKELIFFDMTYELIEREKLKANDEDLFKNKKGELSKLSRLRIVMHLTSAISWIWVIAWVMNHNWLFIILKG